MIEMDPKTNRNNKTFESEIRIKIDDIDRFRESLKSIDSKIIKEYKFIDEVYIPKNNKDWDLKEKCIRIRTYINDKNSENINMSQILFSHIKLIEKDNFCFKQSIYPGGKLQLYSGPLNIAKEILEDLGFNYLFTIKKEKGWLYEIQNYKNNKNFIIALEKITAWSIFNKNPIEYIYLAEIEEWSNNIEEIKAKFKEKLNLLNLDKNQIISYPLPYYFSKILKI